MGITRQYVFNLYFNHRGEDGRGWAERKREQALVYLKRLFEDKAKFSCIAKDENKKSSTLMLRGYVNLNSPCTQAYAKRLLGKFSSCKPSFFGDMVSLCRLLHIDRNLTLTGRLPKIGVNSTKNLKPYATDPKFVVKILLDSMNRNDLEQQQLKTESERIIEG